MRIFGIKHARRKTRPNRDNIEINLLSISERPNKSILNSHFIEFCIRFEIYHAGAGASAGSALVL